MDRIYSRSLPGRTYFGILLVSYLLSRSSVSVCTIHNKSPLRPSTQMFNTQGVIGPALDKDIEAERTLDHACSIAFTVVIGLLGSTAAYSNLVGAVHPIR